VHGVPTAAKDLSWEAVQFLSLQRSTQVLQTLHDAGHHLRNHCSGCSAAFCSEREEKLHKYIN